MIKKTAITAMLAVAAIGFTGLASAQDGAPAASQQQQEQTQQLVQQLRQKAAKLRQIHDETLEANPKLQQQQDDFVAMVKQGIKDQGYDIDAGQKRVEEMTQKLKNDDLGEDERKSVMQDFMAERQSLTQARTSALQEPEIKEAGEQLQQDTIDAMKTDNDGVEELMQDMDDLRNKLQAATQSAQPAPGQPAPAN